MQKKKKKKVKGWSSEQMKGRSSSSLKEDAEKMKKWRCMKQQSWMNLAGKIEAEVDRGQ